MKEQQPEEETQGTKKRKTGQEKQRNNEHKQIGTHERQQHNKNMYILKDRS